MRRIFAGLVGLLLLSQVATAGARTDSVQKLASDEIAFELHSGYLVVVQGSIGPLHGLRFVLDTGATHTAVSYRIADQLSLRRQMGSVINIDRSVKTEWTAVPEVEFGPIRAERIPVMITDLDYFKTLAKHVDAVIGLDLLRQKNFSIDFAAKKVRFGEIEVGQHSTPMWSDDICIKVNAEVDGKPLHLILDSGTPGPLIYEERLSNRAVDYRVLDEAYGNRVNDGVFRATVANVRQLQLGGRDITRTVFLTQSPTKGVLDGIDGLLGLAALKARRVNFDFETNTLSWTN
jgi:predicted aspartyl protease